MLFHLIENSFWQMNRKRIAVQLNKYLKLLSGIGLLETGIKLKAIDPLEGKAERRSNLYGRD